MAENSGLGAIRSLDYVILLCDDLEKMKRFYSDVFGFHVDHEEDGHFISFRVGTTLLALRPRGRAYDGPAGPAERASIQLSFRVPPIDVDLAYEALKEKDVNIIEPPTNQDFAHRTLFFADPENNILEIFADIHPRDAAPESSGVHRAVMAE